MQNPTIKSSGMLEQFALLLHGIMKVSHLCTKWASSIRWFAGAVCSDTSWHHEGLDAGAHV
jgi:hypothetical protein